MKEQGPSLFTVLGSSGFFGAELIGPWASDEGGPLEIEAPAFAFNEVAVVDRRVTSWPGAYIKRIR